jgi:hypothetical protein
MFHVGLLNKFHDDQPRIRQPLPPTHHGHVCLEPSAVLKNRVAARAPGHVEGTATTSGNLGEHRGVPTPLLVILARGRAASPGRKMSCSAFHTSTGSRKERNRQDHILPTKDKEGDRIRSGTKNKGDITFHLVTKSMMMLVDSLLCLLVSLLVGVGAEPVDINRGCTIV